MAYFCADVPLRTFSLSPSLSGTLAVDGWLLHLVQRGGAWTGCNSSPINGQCTNHCSVLLYDGPLLCGFNMAIKLLILTLSYTTCS